MFPGVMVDRLKSNRSLVDGATVLANIIFTMIYFHYDLYTPKKIHRVSLSVNQPQDGTVR